jgi:hypothetical protein
MKMSVFWDVALCSLVFTDVSEAASTTEMSVNFYHTTRCNIPEDSHFNLVLVYLSTAYIHNYNVFHSMQSICIGEN